MENLRPIKLFKPESIWKWGVFFYVFSFLAPPNRHFDDFQIGGGVVAFIYTPVAAFNEAAWGDRETQWQHYIVGAAMIIGWATNFTIYFRLSPKARWVSLALPWILYAGMSFLTDSSDINTEVAEFLPFYPWALGIALIHLSRLGEPKPASRPRDM